MNSVQLYCNNTQPLQQHDILVHKCIVCTRSLYLNSLLSGRYILLCTPSFLATPFQLPNSFNNRWTENPESQILSITDTDISEVHSFITMVEFLYSNKLQAKEVNMLLELLMLASKYAIFKM